MSKEQQKLLNEAYKNYSKKMMYHPVENWLDDENDEKTYRQLSQEEFINKCKTDLEFSEIWRLTIEERELSLEELNILYNKRRGVGEIDTKYTISTVVAKDPTIPRKLITITYNDTKIESYE